MARDAEEFRGRQVTIGKMVFVLPADVPVTDPEVVEREELIARIEKSLQPYNEVVTFGKDVVKMLREDVTRCFRARESDENEQLRLFEIGKEAPQAEGDFKRRMVREAFTNYGWQKRVNDLAQAGATDEICQAFIAEEMPAAEDRRFGEGWLRLTGGGAPSITYLSDLTDKPRDRVHLAGRDLLKAFRLSFAIEVTAKRAKRSA